MEQIELEAKLPPSSTHASAADCGRGRGGGETDGGRGGGAVRKIWTALRSDPDRMINLLRSARV